MSIQNQRRTVRLSMTTTTGITAAVDLMGYRIAAMDVSSGWDAANRMTFRVTNDGTSTSPVYYDLYDDANNPYQIASGGALTSTTGRSIIPSNALALALMAHRYVKIQSGPSTALAVPATGVTIDLILVPM